jgi:hypothetical protein
MLARDVNTWEHVLTSDNIKSSNFLKEKYNQSSKGEFICANSRRTDLTTFTMCILCGELGTVALRDKIERLGPYLLCSYASSLDPLATMQER